MSAEHLSELVPYQLEHQVKQSVLWHSQRYVGSNAVSLFNPKILLLDVMLKQSGVKARKIRNSPKCLVTGTPHSAHDRRRDDDESEKNDAG